MDSASPAPLPTQILGPLAPCQHRGVPGCPLGPAPRPGGLPCQPLARGSAQVQSELDLSSPRWTRRKLLGKKHTVPQADSLTFASGRQAKGSQKGRRLDLVEANLGPSQAGALAGSPAGSGPPRCESVQPQDISPTKEENALGGGEGNEFEERRGDSQTCPQPPLLAADTLPSLSVL